MATAAEPAIFSEAYRRVPGMSMSKNWSTSTQVSLQLSPFSETNSITRPLPTPHIHGASKHTTPFGIGLFAEVPDGHLEAIADPFDPDQNGVLGRISRLADGRSGRFGWQGEMASIIDFVELAFLDELGMSRTEVHQLHPEP